MTDCCLLCWFIAIEVVQISSSIGPRVWFSVPWFGRQCFRLYLVHFFNLAARKISRLVCMSICDVDSLAKRVNDENEYCVWSAIAQTLGDDARTVQMISQFQKSASGKRRTSPSSRESSWASNGAKTATWQLHEIV